MRTRWAANLVLRWSFGQPSRVTRALVDLYQTAAEVDGSEAAFLAMFRAPASPSINPRVKEIRLPTLLVWGEKDRVVGGIARTEQ